jgi:hypothetical protein
LHTELIGGYIVPRASHGAVTGSACLGRERLMEQPVSSELHHSVKQKFKRLSGRTKEIVAVNQGKYPVTFQIAG